MFSPTIEMAGVHSALEASADAKRELLRLLREEEESNQEGAALVGTAPEPIFDDVELIASRLELKFMEEEQALHERINAIHAQQKAERWDIEGGHATIAVSISESESQERELVVSSFMAALTTVHSRIRRRQHDEAELARIKEWASQEHLLKELDQEYYRHDKAIFTKRLAQIEEARKGAEEQERYEMMMQKMQTILEEEDLVEEPYHMSQLGFRSTMEMYEL